MVLAGPWPSGLATRGGRMPGQEWPGCRFSHRNRAPAAAQRANARAAVVRPRWRCALLAAQMLMLFGIIDGNWKG